MPYAIPLLVILLEQRILFPVPALGDHFQFWAAGHLVATGRSPYERASWLAMAEYGSVPGGVAVNTVIGNLPQTQEVWLYPPQTAFLFAPFGALPMAIGVPLLNVFVLATAALGLVMGARAIGLTGPRLAFALTLAAVSEPFVMTVRNGHPIGLILTGLVLAYVGVRDRRAWPIAAGAVLVSIKPQIAFVYAVPVIAILLLRRDVRAIALAAAGVALVTIPAQLVHPFPLWAFLGAGGERSALDLSTTGALARDLGGGIPLTVALLVVGGLAAWVALRLSEERRVAVALGVLFAMSLAISPYVHTYDQLLVVPAAFSALALGRGSRSELAIAGGAAVVWGIMPWVLFLWWPLQGHGDRFYQGGPIGGLPIVALLALALAAWISRAGVARGGPQA